MRRKLMDFKIKWYKPNNKVPDHLSEVLVRFRGATRRFATMVYDGMANVWYVPEHAHMAQSDEYTSREIFAWAALPQPSLATKWEDEEAA